jgi:HEAT repeat protein
MTWWCPRCWAELAGPHEACACGYDPATDRRDLVERLADTLRHPLADRAVHAASVLGSIGDRRAVPALCAALRAADPYLQAEAAAALGGIGCPEAVEPLALLLEQGALPGRMAAVRALSALGGDRARSALLRAAARDPVPAVRELAARLAA